MSAADNLAARLRGQSMIDDPFLGPVTAERFAAASPAWPQHGQWSGLKPGTVTSGQRRSVAEFDFIPADAAQPVLPVGIVWDETGVRAVARVYYNKQLAGASLPGSDVVRAPMVPPEPGLDLHPTMRRYADVLSRGDEQGLLEVLEPGLTVRGPLGVPIAADDVRAAFAAMIASGGGVPVMYVTCTDDGSRAALEFISWRTPPHAGLGVYERAPSGRIAAFRAYEGPVRRTSPADEPAG